MGGKRILVAGSGPLLLAVAAHLQDSGAKIVCIAEQASLTRLIPFGASLLGHPDKLLSGLRYRLALRTTPYRTECWPESAQEEGDGLTVRLRHRHRIREEHCDYLACGFHLLPNVELAALLGCRIADGCIAVNDRLETSVANVYGVGEALGVAGLDAALTEGETAGLMAAGAAPRADRLQARRKTERRFGARLSDAFRLRDELRTLCLPETIVCRCEDVTLAQLQQRDGWTDAKLQTRCGMGSCQGRICGPAVETLLGWKAGTVRPPIFPTPLASLCHALPAAEADAAT